MTCKQFIAFLDEYLADGFSHEVRREFDAHIAHCPDCVRYLEGYRTSIRLANRAFKHSDDTVPADVPDALVRAILAARGPFRS